MQNKICVYAICKNESQFVERWAKSMLEADSVVVLDTGSTDDTVEKLRSFGITVEQKIINPWRFDVARNESMKMIPDDCNILVCTDLDEVLDPGWAKVLRERWIDGVHKSCWYKYVWSHMPDGSDGRIFWYNKIHVKGYQWCFPVHEQLELIPGYEKSVEGLKDLYIDEDGFKLHHYAVPKTSRKSYLPLLELRVQERPEDLSGWHYLTHQYHYESKHKECIECGQKMLEKFESQMSDLDKSNIHLFIGYSYRELKEYDKALASFYKGIEIDKTYVENYLEVADIYLNHSSLSKRFELAYGILKKCFKNMYRHYSWLEKDDSFASRPFDQLSLAAYYSGKKKESLLYAFIARERNKADERLKNNVDIILKNIKDSDLVK